MNVFNMLQPTLSTEYRITKKEYYTKKFSDSKQNPKTAWRTINDILGRNKKYTTINKIKLSGQIVTSTNELVEVFNDYFSNIGPIGLLSLCQLTKTSVFDSSLLCLRTIIFFHSGL